jgi:hypothetical protein
MGLMDKAKGLLKGHEKQAKDGVDKAADVADAKTDAKYTDKIDMGADKTKDAIDKIDE